MIGKGRAFAPGHITGFFKIYPDGSTGGGINTADGVTTEVTSSKGSKTEIYINGKKEKAPVSQNVVDKFLKRLGKTGKQRIVIRHKTKMPISFGLGLSGAGAFSLSLALNKSFGMPFTFVECKEIARWADIEEGCGLGDVIAQEFKGVMLGLPPYPSLEVEEIVTDRKDVVLGFFAPLETKKIIRSDEWKHKINSIGDYCMQELLREKTAENLIRLSRIFTEQTGLANKKIVQAMQAIPDASMSMLGQTIFVLTNKPKDAANILKKFTKRIFFTKVAKHGACLL